MGSVGGKLSNFLQRCDLVAFKLQNDNIEIPPRKSRDRANPARDARPMNLVLTELTNETQSYK